MKWLLDTNILLRLREPIEREALNALDILLLRREMLYITSQNLIEFFVVATRDKEHNGFGISLERAHEEIKSLEDQFPLLGDLPEVYPIWKRLVIKHEVVGIKAYDTRLAATMIAYGLTHILTFNVRDFEKYSEIKPVHPKEIH